MPWKPLEGIFANVLRTSWRRFQNTLNIFWKCLQVVFARHLEDDLARRLEEVLKRLKNVFKVFLQDVLKMSRKKRLGDIWPRQIYWSWSRGLKDVLKTSSEYVWVRWTCSSWSRRLEDVMWRRRRKTFSRCLQDVFIKTNVCWEVQVIKIG